MYLINILPQPKFGLNRGTNEERYQIFYKGKQKNDGKYKIGKQIFREIMKLEHIQLKY